MVDLCTLVKFYPRGTADGAVLCRFADDRDPVLLVPVGEKWHCSDATYEYDCGGPWQTLADAKKALGSHDQAV